MMQTDTLRFTGVKRINSPASSKFKLHSPMGFLNRIFGAMTKGAAQEQSLAPSSIHFLCSKQNEIFAQQPVEQKLLDVYSKRKDDFPKIQVVKKAGYWFALNSAQLQLYRVLEFQGQCAQVKLEVIPLKDVPKELVQMMVPPTSQDIVKSKSCDLNTEVSYSKQNGIELVTDVDYTVESEGAVHLQTKVISTKSSKGYHKLEPTEVTYDGHGDVTLDEHSDADDGEYVTDDDVSDESDCETSLFDPTESEYEWTDAEESDGEFELEYDETTTDDENHEGDENECLL